ncbi:putative 3-hydroxyacyl-CoA dehydrogenase type-2 [Glarea lozoyensis 74030]|uniref:Putative 3-hydroxyacyl-CoA dehydrogenase type-2 n=1 Tax=Glarea lozoyensis (strain ATCC 74030 / MF5533) TaxID=1104152 RepID=H0EK86_GLAL7|nr:putative 3-hydroxyacyl-CoA dehydrogenase type-2 [Glarea lozoyensis 74030]
MKIEGRTFIVSGGASGLGQACVEDICRRGGYAAILDMNEENANEVVSQIGGDKTKFFQCNVLETESIAAAVKGCLAWVKETGKEVGGVIAAAGIGAPAKILDRNLEPFSLSDFEFVMNVNVRGTIDLIRQVLPHMAQTKLVGEDGERGIIIMVSSSAAFDGQPGQARASLTRVMEFPLRPGRAPEFAQLVTQSIENVMLNGVVLRLDGGMRMPSKM